MTQEEKRSVLIAFVHCLATGDFSALPIASDFTAWTPVNGSMDMRQYQQAARLVVGLAPGGMQFTVDGTTLEGDRAAVEAHCRATLRNGQAYPQHYHFAFEFKDGEIHKLRTYIDTKLVADVILPAVAAAGGSLPVEAA